MEARGQRWGFPCTDKLEDCDLKAMDSGKVCTDSKQCQGACLAPPGAGQRRRCNVLVLASDQAANLLWSQMASIERLDVE